MSQVAKNKQLLNIAEDFFQFTTSSFEVINVSATHIYHSALELSPKSSIIRKLYYHRRVTYSPKVVVGTPESWAQTIAISGKEEYDGPCIWSPCGRFVAAQTRRTVEIRNQLTLELITTLQLPKTISHLKGPLAYSPEGRSIACASDVVIIIWDIQTGGVAKEIERRATTTSLVWSLNGGSICTIDFVDQGTFTVRTYDVSSGTISSPGTLRSWCNPHLWTADESFRVMTTVQSEYSVKAIDIFKVGYTLTKIESFSPHGLPIITSMTFSPTTHRISVSGRNTLSISDVRSSENFLREKGHFSSHCFSSDGSLFAASQVNIVFVWKYDSGHYTLCGKSEVQGLHNPPLQLSPTPSSSILGHSKDTLRVLRLHQLPTALETHRQPYVELSRSGTRFATAHKNEKIVTTTDILAQTPCQVIHTGVTIEKLFLTGNILLVVGSGEAVAWLLTEEGLVVGVTGEVVGYGDKFWTEPCSSGSGVQVKGKIGVIGNAYIDKTHLYCTDTGERLDPRKRPRNVLDVTNIFHSGRDHLHFHGLSQCNAPLEDRWQTSLATVREGWVKDAEGKHRLWIPVEWRTDWDPEDWLHDVTIQFSRLGGRSVLIKF